MIPRRKVTTYPGMFRDVLRALVRGEALRGTAVERFERLVAERCGARHGIAVSSGRFGLRLILTHLGLSAGDEVIVPAYTLGELPAVVADCGLTPVLADVAPGSVNCTAAQIEPRITRRTRVILMTHMTGEAADVAGIVALARKHGLIVVEDNAHGLGVTADGRPLGGFGRAGFVSLETRKVVNTLGGGVVTTSDDELAAKVREAVAGLRPSLGRLLQRLLSVAGEAVSLTPPLAAPVLALLHSRRFNRWMVGMYRAVHRSNRRADVAFTNLQAILGIRQIERLDEAIRERNETARLLLTGLAGSTGVLDEEYRERLLSLTADRPPWRHNFYALVLFGDRTAETARRLFALGIDVGTGSDVCDDVPAMYDPAGDYPNARAAIARGIQLPMFPGITRDQVRRICEAFAQVTWERC